MTKLERIHLLLESEQQKITRMSREVTHDPQLSEALTRRDAYEQCAKILEAEET